MAQLPAPGYRYRARLLDAAAGRAVRTSFPRGAQAAVISCGGCDAIVAIGHTPDRPEFGTTVFSCARCGGLNDAAAASLRPVGEAETPTLCPGPCGIHRGCSDDSTTGYLRRFEDEHPAESPPGG